MSKDAKFDYRVAILPTETAGGPHASALGEGDNVILASSKHPKEAFWFVEYLYEQMPRVWNEFGFLPQFGRLDGSFGHLLLGNGKGHFSWTDPARSGLDLPGQIRDIVPLRGKDHVYLLFLQNDQFPVLYEVSQ